MRIAVKRVVHSKYQYSGLRIIIDTISWGEPHVAKSTPDTSRITLALLADDAILSSPIIYNRL